MMERMKHIIDNPEAYEPLEEEKPELTRMSRSEVTTQVNEAIVHLKGGMTLRETATAVGAEYGQLRRRLISRKVDWLSIRGRNQQHLKGK